MEALMALVIGALVGGGVYLILRARTFPVVLGLMMMSYGVNLFIFATGRLELNKPPLISEGASYVDPIPQALVLTAIVIGFAMAAFMLMLAVVANDELGTDHVDGQEYDDDTMRGE
jgi:multicomponent K+:H+ antiporter subunit C